MKKHYYIALVPPPSLQERVERLKIEIRERYGAAHALKSPAHITLQMPFHKPELEEPDLINCLTEFASSEKPFEVVLDGFDCFPPRVIFVRIRDHSLLQDLETRLKARLTTDLGFQKPPSKRVFHPHMTIANRDLKESDFEKAWSEFKDRKFQDSFAANRLVLLKHNGQSWDIYREFPFWNTKES